MRRAALGVIALALIVGGLVALYGGGPADGESSAAASVALRSGVLLAAIWLALPQLTRLFQRVPAWLAAGIAGGLLLLVVQPRLVKYVIPLLMILAALQFASRFLKPPAAGSSRRPPAK